MSTAAAQLEKQLKANIKKAKDKLKEMGKIVGEYIVTGNINKRTLHEAARTKFLLDAKVQEMKALETKYKELQAQVTAQLPGKLEDTVELVIDGVRVHKFPRNKAAGKLNTEKVLQLAHAKGIYQQVAIPTVTINEAGLLQALVEGTICYDEYHACVEKEVIPVVSIGFVEEEEETTEAAQ